MLKMANEIKVGSVVILGYSEEVKTGHGMVVGRIIGEDAECYYWSSSTVGNERELKKVSVPLAILKTVDPKRKP